MSVRPMVIAVCSLLQAGYSSAATTPLDTPLPDGGTIEITVDFAHKPGERNTLKGGGGPEDPSQARDGEYHYTLYVPPGYSTDKETSYPVLFIASPGGNAQIAGFAERARRDRWIVCALKESQNGQPHWAANFMAAHDDVLNRCRVIADMKFGTGMSGGARCCSTYGVFRPGFRGAVLQAAGFWWDKTGYRYEGARNKDLKVYALWGVSEEMNRSELASLQKALPGHVECRAEIFEGGHTWATQVTLEHAFDWLEEQIFTTPLAAGETRLSKAACQWFLERTESRIEAATTDFQRHDAMETALAMVVKARMASDRNIGAVARDHKKRMMKLKSDEHVKKELLAKRNYARAESMEAKARPATSDQVINFFDQVATAFAGTVYGERARVRADSLRKERKLGK